MASWFAWLMFSFFLKENDHNSLQVLLQMYEAKSEITDGLDSFVNTSTKRLHDLSQLTPEAVFGNTVKVCPYFEGNGRPKIET